MKRKYALDFLRIPATVIIVMHHFQQDFEARFPGYINFCGGNFSFGYLVEFFFVLSGFLMLPAVKRIYSGEVGFGTFMFRKMRRLLPMTALCALAYDAVDITAWIQSGFSQPLRASLVMTVADILGIQGGWCFRDTVVNIPSWYVCVLLLCCVLLFLLVRLCKKIKCRIEYGLIAVILLGCGAFSFEFNLPFLNYASSRGYYAFFFGVLLALGMEKYSFHKPKYYILSGIVLLFSLFDILRGRGDGFLIAFFISPALILLFTSPAAERIFRSKIWQTLGNIQFHVYLWQAVIIDLVYVLGKVGLSMNALYSIKGMCAFVLFMELFGAASYFLLEKRADRLFTALLPEKKEI